MLTLFHSPESCSTGILVLLHETGADFKVDTVNVRNGDQYRERYRLLNPKGKVPALLREDGEVLTEFQSIAYWLANAFPEAGLWPETLIDRTRTLAALDFIVGSVHMRGFTFIKVPQKFVESDAAREALRIHGQAQVAGGLAILSDALGNRDYLFGAFGIADAALLYVLDWAEGEGIEMADNLAACLARLRDRRSVRLATGRAI